MLHAGTLYRNPPAPACQGHTAADIGCKSAVEQLQSAVQQLQVAGQPSGIGGTGPSKPPRSPPSPARLRIWGSPGEVQESIEIQACLQYPPRSPNWCPRHPKIVKNDVKNHPRRHQIQQNVKKVKTHKTHRIYNVFSTLDHQILVENPFPNQYKINPGPHNTYLASPLTKIFKI